jgi:hypothetical protein
VGSLARVGGRLAAVPGTVALAAVVVAVVAGCYNVYVTPSPVDGGSRGPDATDVPIGATPWPNGTTGAYGLKIDPSLSSYLPSYVGGNPLVEDAGTELLALDDQPYAEAFNSLYVAQVGDITHPNWVQANVAWLKGQSFGQDFYASWRDDWFDRSCSQAGGVVKKAQDSINDWTVDVATCAGGVHAYTLELTDSVLVSIVDLGPRQLGRQLIEALQH